MKKILFFILIVCNIFLLAEDKPLVCEGKISWLSEQYRNEPRYFILGVDSDGNAHLGDAKTIEVNKKNKLVKMWATQFISYAYQAEAIKKFLQYDQNYNNFGYMKLFVTMDFENRKYKLLQVSHYTCEGILIQSFQDENVQWQYVVSGSALAGEMTVLEKKYGL